MLLRHAVRSVARAARFRHIQGINRGSLVALRKNGVGVSVAARAGVFGGIGVHAAGEIRSLARVAGIACHLGNFFRVRIATDVGVAGVATQSAVDALTETIAVHADVVTAGILQSLVGVTRQAIRLGRTPVRNQDR